MRRQADHRAVAAACRARPGEWVDARSYPNRNSADVTASQVRSGAYTAYRPGGAYAAQVFRDDEGHTVRVRYLAKNPSALDPKASA